MTAYILDNGILFDHIAISTAISLRSLPVIETLFAHRWNINQTGRGLPAFSWAAKFINGLLSSCRWRGSFLFKDAESRRWLLGHGADPTIPNHMRFNVLEFAADTEPFSVLKELVDSGGNPKNCSALPFAVQSSSFPEQRLEKVAYLLDRELLSMLVPVNDMVNSNTVARPWERIWVRRCIMLWLQEARRWCVFC